MVLIYSYTTYNKYNVIKIYFIFIIYFKILSFLQVVLQLINTLRNKTDIYI